MAFLRVLKSFNLSSLTLAEARYHLEAGQFPRGSMGPKIKAAINFLEQGGERVICSRSGEKFENFLLDLCFVDNRLLRDLLVEKSLNG